MTEGIIPGEYAVELYSLIIGHFDSCSLEFTNLACLR